MASARGGGADRLMPRLLWKLTRNDGRTGLMALVEDLQQIAPAFVGELGQRPFVDDQHLCLRQFCQGLVVAVAASEGQVGEQARQAHMQGAVPVAAGLVGPRAGKEGLADTSK